MKPCCCCSGHIILYGWFFLSKKIECMYICKLMSLDRSKVKKGGVSYPSQEPFLHCSGLQIIRAASCSVHFLLLIIIYTLFYKPSLACPKCDKMVLYFGEVNHDCDAGGILKIFYVQKWTDTFSLGVTKLTERVLYFRKVNHECNSRGILKIFYVYKWICIFSLLGILKCNFRGWWRKKAAPRWSGTSKKGIHDWLWI